MYITMDEGERRELDTLLRGIRAQVHSYPELSNREFETTKLVQRHLAALGLEPVELGLPTGAAALLRGGRPGPTVGLRADLDALPVTEQTGAPYGSENEGVMHACGHDVHTSVLARRGGAADKAPRGNRGQYSLPLPARRGGHGRCAACGGAGAVSAREALGAARHARLAAAAAGGGRPARGCVLRGGG